MLKHSGKTAFCPSFPGSVSLQTPLPHLVSPQFTPSLFSKAMSTQRQEGMGTYSQYMMLLFLPSHTFPRLQLGSSTHWREYLLSHEAPPSSHPTLVLPLLFHTCFLSLSPSFFTFLKRVFNSTAQLMGLAVSCTGSTTEPAWTICLAWNITCSLPLPTPWHLHQM